MTCYDTSRRFPSRFITMQELAKAISPNYPYLLTLTLIVVLLRLPFHSSSNRNEKFYTCCDEPYLDISKCRVVLIEFLFMLFSMSSAMRHELLTTSVILALSKRNNLRQLKRSLPLLTSLELSSLKWTWPQALIKLNFSVLFFSPFFSL